MVSLHSPVRSWWLRYEPVSLYSIKYLSGENTKIVFDASLCIASFIFMLSHTFHRSPNNCTTAQSCIVGPAAYMFNQDVSLPTINVTNQLVTIHPCCHTPNMYSCMFITIKLTNIMFNFTLGQVCEYLLYYILCPELFHTIDFHHKLNSFMPNDIIKID